MKPITLQSAGRFTARSLFALMNVYIVFTMLALAAKYVIGERVELVAILNSVLHLLLIGVFPALLIALIGRRWRTLALGLLPALYFVAVYGGMFFPQRARAADEPDFTVMNYNLHAETKILDSMLAVIREADADVVALQELSAEAADYFRAELADIYPHHALHTFPGEPIPGQGVLSRYPIADDEYWRNDTLPLYLAHQRVELDIDGTLLTLYNTHPIHPILKGGRIFNVDLRTQEIQSVLDRALQDSGAVLIVGDFNMTDLSEDYERVTAHFADTYRQVGWGMGFTFPDLRSPRAVPNKRTPLPVRPIVRLDYQFHSLALQPVSAQVWNNSGGSDHMPMLAAYRFVDG